MKHTHPGSGGRKGHGNAGERIHSNAVLTPHGGAAPSRGPPPALPLTRKERTGQVCTPQPSRQVEEPQDPAPAEEIKEDASGKLLG